MQVTQHGQYLVQLTRWWVFNCYFVREEDGLTLIDTGLPGSAKAIIAAAESLEAPIRRIALTHAHGDHVGSLDALAAALPKAEILFTARTARFLTGDLSLDADEPQAKLRGSFPHCQTQASRHLHPGDQVGSLEVIAAPGHSPDHIAFLDRRDGTLIAGDAFQSQGGLAVAGTVRWLFPLPALATWHKDLALQSARALRQLNPSRLAVGHGPVIEQPQTMMDEAIGTAARGQAKSVALV